MDEMRYLGEMDTYRRCEEVPLVKKNTVQELDFTETNVKGVKLEKEKKVATFFITSKFNSKKNSRHYTLFVVW